MNDWKTLLVTLVMILVVGMFLWMSFELVMMIAKVLS